MKKIHIIIIVLLVGAIGVIIATLFKADTYADFVTAAQHPGKEYQVIGKLDTLKGIHYDAKNNADRLSFYVTDEKGVQKKVVFIGTKPQDFEKSEKIVMTGKMENDVFMVSSILLKCPSKFTKDTKNESQEFKSKSK